MTKTWRKSVVLLGAIAIMLSGSVASAQTVKLVNNEKEKKVDVLVDGKPFTSYLYTESLPVLRKPVLFPIRTAKGTAITRGFPLEPRPGERIDHPHHIGMWFNYGNVNGLDFWNNSDAIPAARAKEMGTIRHRAIKSMKGGKGQGELVVTADWVNSDGKVLLREDTRYVFGATGTTRTIDRYTTLTAVNGDVSLKDNKEGVLGIRLTRGLEHPSNDKAEVFTDASGKATTVAALGNEGVTGNYVSSEGKEGNDVWGTRGRWVMLHGTVEGETLTLAILDHPKNVGFPTYWHARGYGLFAANPLGQSELSNKKDTLNFGLKNGESTTFRHRVLILPGKATKADLEAAYQKFQSVK